MSPGAYGKSRKQKHHGYSIPRMSSIATGARPRLSFKSFPVPASPLDVCRQTFLLSLLLLLLLLSFPRSRLRPLSFLTSVLSYLPGCASSYSLFRPWQRPSAVSRYPLPRMSIPSRKKSQFAELDRRRRHHRHSQLDRSGSSSRLPYCIVANTCAARSLPPE